MSQSLRPLNVPGTSPAGQSGTPGRERPSAGDIADEINDHLSCRQQELEAEGVARAAAEEQAQRSFGNAQRIARELFWIHHGERIMSQRLLWTAIVLVFVALMANLYFQLRSAAVMNEAMLRLTEQMGKSQHPLAEARIKVEDENGKPRAGVKVSVTGLNPSPYLSNATYTREFKSDANGLIRTGKIPLGSYRASAKDFDNVQYPFKVFPMGEGFDLLENGAIVDSTLTVPVLATTTVVIQPPVVVGWETHKYLDARSEQRFNGTKVLVDGRVAFGDTLTFPLLPSAPIRLAYELNRHKERGGETFRAVQTLSRSDLLKGGTITIDLPSNEQFALTAEGEKVTKLPEHQHDGE